MLRSRPKRGWVSPKGPLHVAVLASLREVGQAIGASLAGSAHAMFLSMTVQLEQLIEQVALHDKAIARRARENEEALWLMAIPGFGPITAAPPLAPTPPAEGFGRGRNFSSMAWAHFKATPERWQGELRYDLEDE